MIIDPQTAARISRDYDYQSERVRNLLRIAYRDPVLAWEKWEELGTKASGKLLATLIRKPRTFGRLHGRLRFNFLKDQSYRESEQALSELARIAPQWKSALLQVQQLEERQAEAERVPSNPQATWSEQARQRRSSREAKSLARER